jgi:chromosome segregation ATPase
LQAGTDLTVQVQGHHEAGVDSWSDMDSIAAQIETEVREHLGKMSYDVAAQQQIDRALQKADREIAQAEEQIEREKRQAQLEARRAQQRAARAARRAQEKIVRKSRSWRAPHSTEPGLFGPHLQGHRSRTAPPAVAREDQLAVLKMLQEKKITVEEAEQLLSALGA